MVTWHEEDGDDKTDDASNGADDELGLVGDAFKDETGNNGAHLACKPEETICQSQGLTKHYNLLVATNADIALRCSCQPTCIAPTLPGDR